MSIEFLFPSRPIKKFRLENGDECWLVVHNSPFVIASCHTEGNASCPVNVSGTSSLSSGTAELSCVCRCSRVSVSIGCSNYMYITRELKKRVYSSTYRLRNSYLVFGWRLSRRTGRGGGLGRRLPTRIFIQ